MLGSRSGFHAGMQREQRELKQLSQVRRSAANSPWKGAAPVGALGQRSESSSRQAPLIPARPCQCPAHPGGSGHAGAALLVPAEGGILPQLPSQAPCPAPEQQPRPGCSLRAREEPWQGANTGTSPGLPPRLLPGGEGSWWALSLRAAAGSNHLRLLPTFSCCWLPAGRLLSMPWV